MFFSCHEAPGGFLVQRRGVNMSGLWMLVSTALYHDVKLVFIVKIQLSEKVVETVSSVTEPAGAAMKLAIPVFLLKARPIYSIRKDRSTRFPSSAYLFSLLSITTLPSASYRHNELAGTAPPAAISIPKYFKQQSESGVMRNAYPTSLEVDVS